MPPSLKRQHSTGAGLSNHERKHQSPYPPGSTADEEQRKNPVMIGEGWNNPRVSKLHSAAFALRNIDIEVLLSCLNNLDHLGVLLDFPVSEIQGALALAKATRQLTSQIA